MIELLAPAGNLEKLKFAFEYGADAVYLGGKNFSLRNLSGNFTIDEIKTAKDIALKKNKKIYITLNIYPYNEDIENIRLFLEELKDISPDALIVSDPGVILLANSVDESIPVHLSTQSNTTNYKAVEFWHNFGVKRINLARELSIEDIQFIRKKNRDIELEVFIHGAMCMSMSGRCLLSNFLTTRPSNKGECTHPCRWKYYLTEETREGEFFPVEEDARGTYIMNSKDLCGIEFLPAFISMGIDSLKIEGRMKSIYYLSNVVRIYREAIDSYYSAPEKFSVKAEWIDELGSVSNRGYTTGFFLKRNNIASENFKTSGYIRKYRFIGVVKEVSGEFLVIEARNKIFKNDSGEIITKNCKNISVTFDEMYDLEYKTIDFVQPMNKFLIKNNFNSEITPMSIIRTEDD